MKSCLRDEDGLYLHVSLAVGENMNMKTGTPGLLMLGLNIIRIHFESTFRNHSSFRDSGDFRFIRCRKICFCTSPCLS